MENTDNFAAQDATPAFEPSAELTVLAQKLAEAETKARENQEGWQRERASFANYKSRIDRDIAVMSQAAASGLLKKVLPVVDDFDRAARNMPDGLKDNTWLSGLMLIQRKLNNILDSEGVKVIEAKPNEIFDPTQHEAISSDDAPDGIESGHVIEELQRGYMLGEKVLRPALVRVAR